MTVTVGVGTASASFHTRISGGPEKTNGNLNIGEELLPELSEMLSLARLKRN